MITFEYGQELTEKLNSQFQFCQNLAFIKNVLSMKRNAIDKEIVEIILKIYEEAKRGLTNEIDKLIILDDQVSWL